MLAKIRKALAQRDGLTLVAATVAIGWGLGTLARLAEERQAHLEHLADVEAELLASIRTNGEAVAEQRAAAAAYPGPDDVDPLGRAATDIEEQAR